MQPLRLVVMIIVALLIILLICLLDSLKHTTILRHISDPNDLSQKVSFNPDIPNSEKHVVTVGYNNSETTLLNQIAIPNNRVKLLTERIQIASKETEYALPSRQHKSNDDNKSGIIQSTLGIHKRLHKKSSVQVKLPNVRRLNKNGMMSEFVIDNNFKFTLWNFTTRKTHENKLIGQYMDKREELCGGRFVGHAHLFAVLTNVLVDPDWGYRKVGGENLSDVLYQRVDNEYYDLYKGYFKLPCAKKIKHLFPREDYLWEWSEAVATNPDLKFTNYTKIENATIFVKRYEYVDFYRTMTDLYNAFLMVTIFKLEPESTNIVWVDAHPKGLLDATWHTLFGKVIRAGEITQPTLFKTLVWNMMCDNSPISDFHVNWETVPLIEEFREFFLTHHGISPYRAMNCSSVKISLIWRRDMVTHPRNPSGKVDRKIKNEIEIITSLQTAFPHHTIKGMTLALSPMKEQLKYVTEADILIGMHGTELTHALFLHKHAAIVELQESRGVLNYWAFAKWRKLLHASWWDKDGSDTDGFHHIPPNVVIGIVKQLLSGLCS